MDLKTQKKFWVLLYVKHRNGNKDGIKLQEQVTEMMRSRKVSGYIFDNLSSNSYFYSHHRD